MKHKLSGLRIRLRWKRRPELQHRSKHSVLPTSPAEDSSNIRFQRLFRVRQRKVYGSEDDKHVTFRVTMIKKMTGEECEDVLPAPGRKMPRISKMVKIM
jgi:hypothetical protein